MSLNTRITLLICLFLPTLTLPADEVLRRLDYHDGAKLLRDPLPLPRIVEKYDLPGHGIVTIPSASDIKNAVKEEHPRLFLTNEKVAQLKSQKEEDSVLRAGIAQLLENADNLLNEPVEQASTGGSMLPVSKRVLSRIQLLGVAYRMTDEAVYARRGIEELVAVSGFESWRPSHFLGTAEMAHAVGIGYDWFRDHMSSEEETLIVSALVDKALALEPPAWTFSSLSNWNVVCYGGLTVGALAIADSQPEHAMRIIPKALASFPGCMVQYAPNGTYTEGMSYWFYATYYVVLAMGALNDALGEDYGLGDMPGFDGTGFLPMYMSPPSEFYFNFGDSFQLRRAIPFLFWLGEYYDQPLFIQDEKKYLGEDASRFSPLHILWYPEKSELEKEVSEAPLNRVFEGMVPLALFRDTWDTEGKRIWAAIKGGYNQAQHGHLDIGQFELESNGVRWTRDLGRDNIVYQGGAFGARAFAREGRRWEFFAHKAESHNVPLINGKGQDPLGGAFLRNYSDSEARPFVVFDLTDVYKWTTGAHKVKRGMLMDPKKHRLAIQDEIIPAEDGIITLPFATDTVYTINDDGSVLLEKDGEVCLVRLVGVQDFKVETERSPGLGDMVGRDFSSFTRILFQIPAKAGEETTVIMEFLSGVDSVEAVSSLPQLVPLDKWK